MVTIKFYFIFFDISEFLLESITRIEKMFYNYVLVVTSFECSFCY